MLRKLKSWLRKAVAVASPALHAAAKLSWKTGEAEAGSSWAPKEQPLLTDLSTLPTWIQERELKQARSLGMSFSLAISFFSKKRTKRAFIMR